MTNNQLTEAELTETLDAATSGYPLTASAEANLRRVFAELQERRKADKPPVHPAVASEKLDDETLQELIEFRRTTFEYHSKEGNKVQTIIHGVTLSALRELQERRKTAEPELKPANLANKFYERYPLATFKSDSERAEAFGYFMAGAELQCFGEFIKYEDLCGDE